MRRAIDWIASPPLASEETELSTSWRLRGAAARTTAADWRGVPVEHARLARPARCIKLQLVREHVPERQWKKPKPCVLESAPKADLNHSTSHCAAIGLRQWAAQGVVGIGGAVVMQRAQERRQGAAPKQENAIGRDATVGSV
ncbi:MAG: hypothetical protein CMD92_07155 [Gammaproteobacteria bacterium]|nr:hypothetical protein [Gammaproteobacteria bacterium]